MVSVKNKMTVANLGFDDGKKTYCRIGADWKIERKIVINEGRLRRIEFIEEQESKNLKEAQAKEQRRLARKGKSSDELKKRLNKISLLKRKLDRKIKNLRTQEVWNKDGIIIVSQALSPNVDLVIGGKGILVSEHLKEVMVTSTRLRMVVSIRWIIIKNMKAVLVGIH